MENFSEWCFPALLELHPMHRIIGVSASSSSPATRASRINKSWQHPHALRFFNPIVLIRGLHWDVTSRNSVSAARGEKFSFGRGGGGRPKIVFLEGGRARILDFFGTE